MERDSPVGEKSSTVLTMLPGYRGTKKPGQPGLLATVTAVGGKVSSAYDNARTEGTRKPSQRISWADIANGHRADIANGQRDDRANACEKE